MLSAHEKILKATEKEVKKKEKLAEYKNLDKKYQKTKADLTTINAKFMKNVRNNLTYFSSLHISWKSLTISNIKKKKKNNTNKNSSSSSTRQTSNSKQRRKLFLETSLKDSNSPSDSLELPNTEKLIVSPFLPFCLVLFSFYITITILIIKSFFNLISLLIYNKKIMPYFHIYIYNLSLSSRTPHSYHSSSTPLTDNSSHSPHPSLYNIQ